MFVILGRGRSDPLRPAANDAGPLPEEAQLLFRVQQHGQPRLQPPHPR